MKLLKIYTGMKNLSDGNGRTKEVLNVWTTINLWSCDEICDWAFDPDPSQIMLLSVCGVTSWANVTLANFTYDAQFDTDNIMISLIKSVTKRLLSARFYSRCT